ncbi:hypothetical protein [Burkholderia cenocepacia]|uniref:hypothetical protein n=1 Tax=Burkholderia cenocepacia TaxID=95486 RepID=UPI00222F6977|nr:hypothetical protein [Burkholderia cenocepacia]MCW3640446.1 hypothetical protein [Burkholderia cenocepacia]
MSEDAKKQSDKKHVLEWPWTIILSIVGVVMLGTAYSLGDAYYVSYLRVFSIDSAAFPIDRSRHLVLAMWGALNASLGFQSWLSQYWAKLLQFTGVMAALLAVLFLAGKGLKLLAAAPSQSSGKARRFLERYPTVKQYLGTLFFSVLIAGTLGWFCIFVPVFISIPSGIGDAAGQIIAMSDKKDYDVGCEKSKAKCYSILRDGKEAGRGYVIAQSDKRIALYNQGEVVQLPVENAEMRTIAQPPSVEVKQPAS